MSTTVQVGQGHGAGGQCETTSSGGVEGSLIYSACRFPQCKIPPMANFSLLISHYPVKADLVINVHSQSCKVRGGQFSIGWGRGQADGSGCQRNNTLAPRAWQSCKYLTEQELMVPCFFKKKGFHNDWCTHRSPSKEWRENMSPHWKAFLDVKESLMWVLFLKKANLAQKQLIVPKIFVFRHFI